ncbi:MAG TPA: hypothetical protein ENI87_14630, partial [bacterium]|nr:hypothetical protein [bacterium]
MASKASASRASAPRTSCGTRSSAASSRRTRRLIGSVATGARADVLEVVDRFRPRTERSFVERVVAAVREHVGRPDLEVSLLLTDDDEIAALHGEYLDDPTPTDVMSFALDGGAEIVVSVET